MKLNHAATNRRARIEMVPLIDIVFLLLVFFIYAMLSMAVHRGVKVDLPSAATAEVDDSAHIAITVDEQNHVYFNKRQVTVPELPGLVKSSRAEKEDMPVFIAGDRCADLGLAIEILDVLRKSGIDRVSFQARRGKKATPGGQDETH